MTAFFDTSVHIEILRGRLSADAALSRVEGGPVRLCPVVAHELLRGARGPAVRAVSKLVTKLVRLDPPSWAKCWIEAGKLLPKVFADHETIGLARLQNDVLLALTARHTGAVFVTRDAHFAAIRKHVPFRLVTLA